LTLDSNANRQYCSQNGIASQAEERKRRRPNYSLIAFDVGMRERKRDIGCDIQSEKGSVSSSLFPSLKRIPRNLVRN
jgi:hypothetical protein